MYYEVETYEESYKKDVYGEIDSGSERRDWRSCHTKGTCVIWCGKNPFWRLIFGSVGLRVTWIWGGSEVWSRPSRICCPDTPCNK